MIADYGSKRTIQSQQGHAEAGNSQRANSHWRDSARDSVGTFQDLKYEGFTQMRAEIVLAASAPIASGEWILLEYVIKIVPTRGPDPDDVRVARYVLGEGGPDDTKWSKLRFRFKNLPKEECLIQSYVCRRARTPKGDFEETVSAVQLHVAAVHLEFLD